MDINEIPEHVSWAVVDAWMVKPPCSYTEPYCHKDCPCYYECFPEEFETDDPYDLDSEEL